MYLQIFSEELNMKSGAAEVKLSIFLLTKKNNPFQV